MMLKRFWHSMTHSWQVKRVIQEPTMKHLCELSPWLAELQWLQKSMTLILKGNVGLGQFCRMFWVPTKNSVTAYCMRLSSQAHCHISSLPHQPQQTSRQADTEGVDVSDLSALMDLDGDEILIGDCLPLPPTCPLPPTSPASHASAWHTIITTSLPSSVLTVFLVPISETTLYHTLFLLYPAYAFIISLLLLPYVRVILGFIYYLVGYFGVWEHSHIFPFKLTVIASLLYEVLAYESLRRLALLSDSEGNLYSTSEEYYQLTKTWFISNFF